uniref:hypothetical protein n=1 Tax=Porodaedalea mongolica TaxID=2651638 RepID=UPI0021ACFDA7|nr:hypothetical protein NYK79_mgp01 [Porodaedalea mongolica]UUA03989.1 hypothetical protein [Porodaedalea mongolica]WCF76693.1 hypothetical protein [Porodaedalea mongolica]
MGLSSLSNKFAKSIFVVGVIYLLNRLGLTYLSKLDKVTLLKIFVFLKSLFRLLVYLNIITAVLLYLISMVGVEQKFSWDLLFYLFIFLYYFLRDSITDYMDKTAKFLKSSFENLINQLNEVKDSVNNKDSVNKKSTSYISERNSDLYNSRNEVTSQSKKAYKSWFDSGKINDITPKYDFDYWFYTKLILGLMVTCAIFYLAYLAYNDPADALIVITKVLSTTYLYTKKIITYPAKQAKKVWNFFKKRFGGGGGLPRPAVDKRNPEKGDTPGVDHEQIRREVEVIASQHAMQVRQREAARAEAFSRSGIASGSGLASGSGQTSEPGLADVETQPTSGSLTPTLERQPRSLTPTLDNLESQPRSGSVTPTSPAGTNPEVTGLRQRNNRSR